MKCAGYFLLLCGLVSSPVWGQPAPKNQPLVMRNCVGLSCSSSVTFAFRRAQPEVILGTFESSHARVLNLSPRRVVLQASMETLLAKTSTFSFPTVVGVRKPIHNEQERHKQEGSEVLQAQGSQPK